MSTLALYRQGLESDYENAQDERIWINTSMNNFGSSVGTYMDATAVFWWDIFHEHMVDFCAWVTGYNAVPYSDALLEWMELAETELGGGGDLTMSDIINTMLSASYEELEYFIGIVDAYRVALWDKPFNEDFYRALAEGFKA